MKEPSKPHFTQSEERTIEEALSGWLPTPTASDPVADHARDRQQTKERADAALRRADLASRRGDVAEAKRWSDVAAKLTQTAERLAQAIPVRPEEEEEAQRADLLQRLQRLAESDRELQRWQMRLEIWEEMAAEARRVGAPPPPPMPPRPAHWTDSLPADLREQLDQD